MSEQAENKQDKTRSPREIIQSYKFTMCSYNFSTYQKRIMYRLTELCQSELEGKKLNKDFKISKEFLNRSKVIEMPINVFLKDENDKNYEQVKKALKGLRELSLEWEIGGKWTVTGVILKADIERSIATITVDEDVYKVLLDFSQGFRRYEMFLAMSFRSSYTMRFYEMMAGANKELTYSLEALKKMFQLEEKYNNITMIKNRIIEPAKKELDKLSPYSFKYEPVKRGRKITGFKFIPRYIKKNEVEEIEKKNLNKQTSVRWELTTPELNVLKNMYQFTDKGIKSNIELFKEAKQSFDLLEFTSSLYPKASRKDNMKGYLIGAIKKELNPTENKKKAHKPTRKEQFTHEEIEAMNKANSPSKQVTLEESIKKIEESKSLAGAIEGRFGKKKRNYLC